MMWTTGATSVDVWAESWPGVIGVLVGALITISIQVIAAVRAIRRREYVAIRLLIITMAQRRAFVSREANKAEILKDRERVTLSVLAVRDQIAHTRESLRMTSDAWSVLDEMIQHCNVFLELMEEGEEVTRYRSLAADLRRALEPRVARLAATWKKNWLLGDRSMPNDAPGSLAYPMNSGLSRPEL